jgi:NAD(P)-dependent dehydrogenase (short-subunit alcohol dehydrogenase family)
MHGKEFKLFSISNKVAIITGAASGIGFEIAKKFAEQDARVVLVDKSPNLIEKAMEINGETFCINTDLTINENITAVVHKTIKQFNGIDILINAAGINYRKKLDQYDNRELDLILDVNLKVVFKLSNEVSEFMKNQKWGRIINIASTQGLTCWNGTGDFSLAPYCASKAGVIAITKSFALDLAKQGITVNAICPSFIDTPLIKPVKEDPALYEDIINRTPIGRLGKVSEISAAALFLASKESSFITGHPLLVDGGWTI